MSDNPLSQAELARAWGLSRARVSQYAKSGMPLTSLEEADAWRTAHYPTATRNGTGGGPKNQTSADLEGGAVPPPPEPARESDLQRDDPIGTLARLKKNEMLAWGMLARAVNEVKNGVGSDTDLMTRQRQYRDAAKLRVEQESKVDEILLRRRDLVTLEEANAMFGRHLQSLRLSLRPLPRRLAARCNPSDPELAFQELTGAIERVFKTMNEWKA